MLIHQYIELKRLVEDLGPDIDSLVHNYTYKSGTSARKTIQDIRFLCVDIRNNIQVKRSEEKLLRAERVKKRRESGK